MKGGFDPDKHEMLDLYRMMLLVRYFEQKVEYGFSRDEIYGTTHLCIGQEAVPAGVCIHLLDDDYAVSTHRGHGHALCKGLSVERLLAEIMGKSNGYGKGKGGTQHVACFEKGFLGTNGITGGGIPIATGSALAIKYKALNRVAVSFFGDGATNQGTFHESLNMAALWKLPVLFVCENNSYGMSTHIEKSISSLPIVKRADAYGMEGVVVDGMNVLEVYNASKKLIQKIRSGSGPKFMECRTYRFRGHSRSDPRVYRGKKEEKLWKDKCPINGLKNKLLQNGIADEGQLSAIQKEINNEIQQAYDKALKSQYPAVSEALEDIFVE